MEWIHHMLQHWGYVGIFILIMLDNINIPMPPTEVVLSLAGWYIATGHMAFWPVVLVSTLGGTLGCMIFYGLVRYGGHWLIPFMQKHFGLSDAKIDRANQLFYKYGGFAIFLGRLIPGLRTVSLLPAGLTRYSAAKATILLFAGTLLWNFFLLSLGHEASKFDFHHIIRHGLPF